MFDFQEKVINTSKNDLVIVDFYAPWCGPCKTLGPVLEKLSEEEGFRLVALNTEENQEIAQQFSVMSIPTVIFFKNGEPVDMFVGSYPEHAIKEMIAKHK